MKPQTHTHGTSARFWARVSKTEGCWLWTGLLNPKGYGLIRPKGDRCSRLAHRVSWMLHFGSIPDGLAVCHHCDVRNCVRPSHLFLGTQAMNLRDMYAKDRHPKGEDRGHAKLTAAAVVEIRDRYARGGVRQIDIAREYGVSQGVVSEIVRGKRWCHVPLSSSAEAEAAGLAKSPPSNRAGCTPE